MREPRLQAAGSIAVGQRASVPPSRRRRVGGAVRRQSLELALVITQSSPSRIRARGPSNKHKGRAAGGGEVQEAEDDTATGGRDNAPRPAVHHVTDKPPQAAA